ncbi:MAG: type VI secretion system baseplate subunit TssE [Pseudomonas sp.]|uniref:type VI secretion system baseplate subunit TssE n=1 Tax=Pseudomonas sp. TaxID=306 RepID=UPI003391FFCA
MSRNKPLDNVRSNRLMPALLDRLTDHRPLERSEAPHQRVVSKAEYRQSVLRDLSWLFNTINGEATSDYSAAAEARHSVLNFGILALSGRQMANDDWGDVETAIRRAILTFEPRILPDSLRIRMLPMDTRYATRNQLSLEIKGQLWSEPYPIDLLLSSHIDLETGQIVLHDGAGA